MKNISNELPSYGQIKTSVSDSVEIQEGTAPTDYIENRILHRGTEGTRVSANYAFSFHTFNVNLETRRKNKEFIENISGILKIKEGFTIKDIFKALKEYI